MTETSINYAKALYGLSVPEEAICETGKIFKNTPEIGKIHLFPSKKKNR